MRPLLGGIQWAFRTSLGNQATKPASSRMSQNHLLYNRSVQGARICREAVEWGPAGRRGPQAALSSSVPLVKGGRRASSLGLRESGNPTAPAERRDDGVRASQRRPLAGGARTEATVAVTGTCHRLLRAREVCPATPRCRRGGMCRVTRLQPCPLTQDRVGTEQRPEKRRPFLPHVPAEDPRTYWEQDLNLSVRIHLIAFKSPLRTRPISPAVETWAARGEK